MALDSPGSVTRLGLINRLFGQFVNTTAQQLRDFQRGLRCSVLVENHLIFPSRERTSASASAERVLQHQERGAGEEAARRRRARGL